MEKQHEAQRLQEEITFIEEELLDKNSASHLLDPHENTKLNTILEKSKKYLHKLNSNEFEIAVVGLEKAGKSTFSNALIESDALPSAPERCTFTSTRLVYGNDKATVEFYNEEEFQEIFKNLLAEVEYPNSQKESFKTLSQEKFEGYFTQLESKNPALYKSHLGKTDEEIKDILKVRDRLLLNQPIKEFSGDELLSDSFQAYIKGENKGDDTSKPRSVKRVEIASSKLKQMQTAILYDVPGFDSPTKIHERQTLERLKSADAIILITNAGRNPSLVGTQLNTVTKHSDSDGTLLKDKLFVFGNQLDTANSKEESLGNVQTLRKDVQKYKIAEDKRVFTGSAYQYLFDKGIKKEPLNTFELESSGVDEIRKELQNYYENDRFKILKDNVHKMRKKLKELFKELESRFDTTFDPDFAKNEKTRIKIEAYKEIGATLDNNLRNLKNQLKNEILEEQYFSQKFTQDVRSLNYFKEIDEKTYEQTKINEDESLSRDIPIERINQAIRKELHKQFLQEFSDLIKYMTDEKSRDIEMRILEQFVQSILGQESMHIQDEIENESEKLIRKLTADISHNEGRFTYLIERFSRDIFDILISYPLLSHDRREKFAKATQEFKYLDYYYQKGDGTLVNMLLSGKTKPLQSGTELSSITQYVTQILSITANMASFNAMQSIETIKTLANTLKQSIATDDKPVTQYNITEIIKDQNRATTKEEVIEEINQDISNLRIILEKAVVKAISLESAFLNGVDKQIKVLIDAFKSHNTKNSQDFDAFISKMVPKVKRTELESINDKLERYKMQNEIVKKIRAFEV